MHMALIHRNFANNAPGKSIWSRQISGIVGALGVHGLISGG
jgi:hypothetical protein